MRAIEAKAKVSGLLVQKVEVGGVGDFDDCESVDDVKTTAANTVLAELIEGFKPVD